MHKFEKRQVIGRLRVNEGDMDLVFVSLDGEDSRSAMISYHRGQIKKINDLNGKMVVAKAKCRIVPNEDAEDEIVQWFGLEEIEELSEAPFVVSEFPDGSGDAVQLRTPIEMLPDFSDDLVAFSCPELSIISSWGMTRAKAEHSFIEDLTFVWNFYGLAKDDSLGPTALELKAAILARVTDDWVEFAEMVSSPEFEPGAMRRASGKTYEDLFGEEDGEAAESVPATGMGPWANDGPEMGDH
jgi:hypothetical protein